jgi:hypothetical protein
MTDVDRSRTGCPSLHNFYTFLAQCGNSFHHIQANTVLVVDHLGRNIPIPTIFCSDWNVGFLSHCYTVAGSHIFITQGFDYIINRYCENAIGFDFIRRGEYKIIHNNKVIESSKFANTAGSETKFEISIVMRQTESFTKSCPQCGKFNYDAAVICGWIKWQVVPNCFHAVS